MKQNNFQEACLQNLLQLIERPSNGVFLSLGSACKKRLSLFLWSNSLDERFKFTQSNNVEAFTWLHLHSIQDFLADISTQ